MKKGHEPSWKSFSSSYGSSQLGSDSSLIIRIAGIIQGKVFLGELHYILKELSKQGLPWKSDIF